MAKQKFYFTFGNSETMQFQGGWIIINAHQEQTARTIYNQVFKKSYAFCYSEKEFENTEMFKTNNNLGHGLWEEVGKVIKNCSTCNTDKGYYDDPSVDCLTCVNKCNWS